MQEKDIKEQLNQELDKMAPDILEKVLEKPIEPIEQKRICLTTNLYLKKKRTRANTYGFHRLLQ